MVANTSPIFCRIGDPQVGGAILGPTAVTATDGTGALQSIFQADPSEGGYVDSIDLKAVGSPAASVARFFLYIPADPNAAFVPGTSNTSANTSLIGGLPLQAWTANNLADSPPYPFSIRKQLGRGHRILIGFGTSTGAATNGYAVTTWGGEY